MANIKTVLIVGAGPTGLTAAMELARQGISVRLIEKLRGASTTSRALGVQARTLELFEQRGLSEEMVRLGNPVQTATIYGRGRRLAQQSFAELPSRFPYILMLSQAETERLLTEEIASLGVQIERSVVLAAFSQTGDGPEPDAVHAVLRHGDGTLEEVDAAYMIAAEGAHSSVRKTLGMKFEGKTLTQKYLLGDLHIEGPVPDEELSMFLGDLGFLAAFPMGKRRFRLIASETVEAQRAAEPTIEELQAAYDATSPVPAKLHDMVWSSHFSINSRMLHHLRQGRVFFGGDSAHVHSPAGGQGMNTGIQDMVDLGWKLAMVLKGQASEELLSTFEAERIPVLRGILAMTEAMTAGIDPENVLRHEMVTHLLPLALDFGFMQKNVTSHLSQIHYGYQESPLSMNHEAQSSLRAGDRVPDLEVVVSSGDDGARVSGEAVRLQTLVDTTHLTVFVAGEDDAAGVQRGLQDALAPWKEITAVKHVGATSGAGVEKFTKLFGNRRSVVVVRPDSYVGFAGGSDCLDEMVLWLKRWFLCGQEHHAGRAE